MTTAWQYDAPLGVEVAKGWPKISAPLFNASQTFFDRPAGELEKMTSYPMILRAFD